MFVERLLSEKNAVVTMSTETDPKHEPSLDESVETLLSEMSQTVDRLETQLGQAAEKKPAVAEEAASADGVQSPLQDLASAVDEMLREVVSVVQPSATESVAIEPETVEAVGVEQDEAVAEPAEKSNLVEAVAGEETAVADPLDVVIDSMTQEVVDEGGKPSEGVDAVDEALGRDAAEAFASLSDELLAGLDAVAAPEINLAALVVAAKPTATVEPPPPPVEDAFSSLTDELLNGLGEVPPPPEPEAVVVPDVAAVVVASSVAVLAAPAAIEPIHTTTTARRVLHAAGHAGMAAAHAIEPHALRAAAAISAPLNSKPRALRDTIGWLGVYTLFVGLTLGVYVRFIHEAPSPTPGHPGVKLAEQNDRNGAAGEVARSDTQGGGAGGEHGGAADGHGAPKDDGHGAKKDDGHGGAPKGDGKSAGAPKLPVPAFKPGPEKPGAKKDAKKKEESKGGGH